MSCTVRADAVSVDLEGHRILHDVDLSVQPGELVALVGPNGAGKSTLLAALAGDLPLAAGRVSLEGKDVARHRAADLGRLRAVLMQKQTLAFGFRAEAVVEMGRTPWHRTPRAADDEQVVRRSMERTDVLALADRVFSTLSGGEQSRVAFARLLAQEVPVLFLDEPTAALDVRHQEAVLDVAQACARAGAAVVVVLHDLSLAAAYADRICVLAAGRVRADGPPRAVLDAALLSEVYEHPLEVVELLGQLVVVPVRRRAGLTNVKKSTGVRMRWIARIAGALLLVGVLTPISSPAQAAARVAVTNEQGSAVIDSTYATSLSVSASGFQSVRNGHGGVYVFFGTVGPGWRPSVGGQTGKDYFYVPDSEGKNNSGYQRYVSFPGSDTAASANGGSMSDAGAFRATITVPGAVFDAVDRNNVVRSVDCRKATCGIITVGAHGVTSAPNETFTPVRVASMYDEGSAPAEQESGAPAATPGTTPGATVPPGGSQPDASNPRQPGATPAMTGNPRITIDRRSARVGAVMSFTARGLPAGRQVTATLDDGVAVAGPLTVGPTGQLAGMISIPAGIGPGTHQLRLVGTRVRTVSFAISGATSPSSTVSEDSSGVGTAPLLFAGGAALLFLLALIRLTRVRLALTRRRSGVHTAAVAGA